MDMLQSSDIQQPSFSNKIISTNYTLSRHQTNSNDFNPHNFNLPTPISLRDDDYDIKLKTQLWPLEEKN